MPEEQYQVRFQSSPPPKKYLRLFFNQENLGPTSINLDTIVAYRPHFELNPVWVILQASGAKIGIATLYIPPSKRILNPPVFIGNFLIRYAERKRGAGAHLLTEIEHYCINRGFLKLALEYSQSSLSFWRSRGFCIDARYPTLLFKHLLIGRIG